jgi:hypothetical protein
MTVIRHYDEELADVLAMLHPATVPMLQRLFEVFKREVDGQTDLMKRADRAIAAVEPVMEQQNDLK